jgi:PAS domain S-box-containing protein
MPTALDDGNFTSQFWIFTRFFESLLLLSAPWFLQRPVRRGLLMVLFGGGASVAAAMILGGWMPATYTDGVGLTRFKITAEYVIILIMLGAIYHLYRRRELIEPRILRLMLISIVLTMGAELAFTFYVSMYGLSNLLGHLFKLFSFWLIYFAIIRTTLAEPFSVMARGSSTYNAVPDPTLLVDKAGVIHQVNQAACWATGRKEVELIGQHAHEWFHPRDLTRTACPLCQSVSRGEALPLLELPMGQADQWRQFSLTPIPGKEHAGASVLVSSDITQRKRAEAELHETLRTLDQKVAQRTQELAAKIEELEHTRDQLVASEKMASLGRMVAGFAHEINTPIGIAVGAVSQGQESIHAIERLLAQEEVDEKELMEHLETVLEAEKLAFSNLQRAANLVQRFKRSSVDQASLARRRFQIREVIEDVLASLHNQIKKTRLEVIVDCVDEVTVYGSPGVIEQILLNLLQNSLLHAYPDPVPEGRIRLVCRLQQEQLSLEYSDDGRGMDKESVAHVFEPFFTTRRGEGGSGLGLYVCYNLINQEGGSIECDSTPGAGTRFHLRLPVKPGT